MNSGKRVASTFAVVCLTVFSTLGNAQQGQVSGPTVGYVFDGSGRAVRPVLGVPGSSIVGSAVRFEYELVTVAVSPGADSAVVTAADGSLHLVALSGGSATEIPFNGSSARPDRVVYSPSGTAVALITGGHAQIFRGLPASASLAGTMDLGGFSAARSQVEVARRPVAVRPTSMALSDDGAWFLAAENGSVDLLGSGGSHSIASAGRGAMVAFAPGSHDAAWADPAAHRVTLVRDASGAPTSQTVWEDASVVHPTGLAFAMDGKSLLLASGAGNAVTVLDLAAGTHTAVPCTCSASGLERMGTVYRLNELGSGPLWLLDTGASAPRIVFVPAIGGGSD